MGFFDSKTKVTSSSSTVSENINNVDNRVIEGSDARVGGNVTARTGDHSPLTISTTDQGAVQAGLDLSLESLALVREVTSSNAAASKDAVSQAYGLAQAARQSETSGAINNFLKYGAIVAGLAFLAWAYKSRKS